MGKQVKLALQVVPINAQHIGSMRSLLSGHNPAVYISAYMVLVHLHPMV